MSEIECRSPGPVILKIIEVDTPLQQLNFQPLLAEFRLHKSQATNKEVETRLQKLPSQALNCESKESVVKYHPTRLRKISRESHLARYQ